MFAAFAAALLLGAVASASASAEACTKKAGSKKFTLCVEGQKYEGTEELWLKQTSPTAVFELPEEWKETGKPPMAEVCTALGGPTGHVEGATAQLSFKPQPEECALQNSVKCQSFFVGGMREEVGSFGTGPEQVLVAPKVGTEIATLETENAPGKECNRFFTTPLQRPFKGKYECKLKEAEVETVLHELRCESQGRETLFAERPAHIRYTQTVELNGKNFRKKFSIYER
jgi:hypothetical protein